MANGYQHGEQTTRTIPLISYDFGLSWAGLLTQAYILNPILILLILFLLFSVTILAMPNPDQSGDRQFTFLSGLSMFVSFTNSDSRRFTTALIGNHDATISTMQAIDWPNNIRFEKVFLLFFLSVFCRSSRLIYKIIKGIYNRTIFTNVNKSTCCWLRFRQTK